MYYGRKNTPYQIQTIILASLLVVTNKLVYRNVWISDERVSCLKLLMFSCGPVKVVNNAGDVPRILF